MTDSSNHQSAFPAENAESESTRPPVGVSGGQMRLSRLALKELRETLRDRRTIVTLILMPLLVYPILSLVFRTFLTTNAGLFGDGKPVVLQIVYGSDGDEKQSNVLIQQLVSLVDAVESQQGSKAESTAGSALDSELDQSAATSMRAFGALANSADGGYPFVPIKAHRWLFVPEQDEHAIREFVEKGEADVGIFFRIDEAQSFPLGQAVLISRQDTISRAATGYLEEKLALFNEQMQQNLMRRARLPTEPAIAVIDQPIQADSGAVVDSGGFSLASLIPLILVLMTITGAVYPAIDLTAGEKERGTLETLMAAPISRVAILVSKFSAVLTVAVLTALLNMIGMAATIWAFRLDQFLAGTGEFTLMMVLKIFLLLILFAAFFSAVLLAVTSYARSFKEAQAYLIPIILLSMGPGLLAMTPGLSLTGIWAVMPMVNILLLARDVIQNQVMIGPAFVAILSTVAYASFAIVVAARTFGSDSILYSTHGSFGEMFTRPTQSQPVVPLTAAIFCVVLLFPINFVLIGFLGRLPSDTPADLSLRFVMMSAFTILSFVVFPLLIGRHQRTPIKTGFGFKQTRWIFYVSALLLGISLWPIVISLLEGWHEVYGWLAGAQERDAWHNQLVEETTRQVARVRLVSPLLIGICLAIVPAVCEEWFFRGMLLRSLLKSSRVWQAIIISAAVFGAFHVLSNSVVALDRLVPTTLVGMVLGYLAYKSDSILPGILLHALHNAAVSFLAYFQPQLSRYSWFPGESDAIPYWWVLIAVAVAAVGWALLVGSKRDDRGSNEIVSGSVAEVV